MAITRLGHIKQAVGSNKSIGVSNAIKYIINPEKTERGKLVGVHNLVMDPSDVAGSSYNQMVQTKEAYGKLTGRQGYHYKISFAKDDKVTPEMAMEIAKEFCEETAQKIAFNYNRHFCDLGGEHYNYIRVRAS